MTRYRIAIVAVLGSVVSVLSAPPAGAADVPTPIGRFGDYVPVFGASGVNGTKCAAPTKQWVGRNTPIGDGIGGSHTPKGAVTAAVETTTRDILDGLYPNVVDGHDRQDVYWTYYRGRDDHLHAFEGCRYEIVIYRDGKTVIFAQSNPGGIDVDLGGGLTSSPSAVARSDGRGSSRPFVFVRGSNGELWYMERRAWHWLGGSFVGDPVAVTSNGGTQIDVFVVNQAGEVWDSRSTDGVTFTWRRATYADVGENWTNITAAYVYGEFRIVQLNTTTREVRIGHVDPAGRYAYSDSFLGDRYWPDDQPWPTQGPVVVGTRIYDVMYAAGAAPTGSSVPASTDLGFDTPFS